MIFERSLLLILSAFVTLSQPAFFEVARAESVSKSKLKSSLDLAGPKQWLNVSRPIGNSDLTGRVVVLDFWTFACINCIHMIPELKKLEEFYGDKIAVIGVHSGKFDNEKKTSEIEAAIARYGIQHAVINDPDFILWERYAVSSWPTIAIFGANGEMAFKSPGEMSFEELRKTIDPILLPAKAGASPNKPLPLALSKKAYSTGVFAFNSKIAGQGDRLFVANSGKNQISEMTNDGKIVSSVGDGAPGFRDGKVTEAQFRNPQGLCVRDGGNEIVVADTDNHAVRVIHRKEGNVSTILEEGKMAGSAMVRQTIRSPWAVECVGDKIYVAMAGTHQIGVLKKVGDKFNFSNFVGSGDEEITDGPRLKSTLAQPSALQFDANKDRLYFLDSETSALRYVDMKTENVVTLIGQDLFEFGLVDGKRDKARMQHPLDFTLLKDGNLLIADSHNHVLRHFDTTTQVLKTVKSSVKFEEPSGVFVKDNKIFVSSTNAHKIFIGDLGELSDALKSEKEIKFSEFGGTSEKKAFLPNLSKLSTPKIRVKPGDNIFNLEITLPEKDKFNEQFPAFVILPSGERRGWLPWSEKTMKVNIPADVKSSEFSVSFAYCAKTDTAVCNLKSLTWALATSSKVKNEKIVLKYDQKE